MGKLTVYRLNNCDLSPTRIAEAFNENYSPEEIILKAGIRAKLYFLPAKPRTPEWLDYLTPLMEKPKVLKTSTSGGVLFTQLNDGDNFLYAITWGAGHFLLRPSAIQNNFGLRCALNLMSADDPKSTNWDPERLRALTAKRIGPNTYIYQGQFAKKATLDSFPFSIDADQLRNITGIPMDQNDWGKSISGGVSLHIKAPEKPEQIIAICAKIDEIYALNKYQNSFAWFDNYKYIEDEDTLTTLDEEIIFRIKTNTMDGLTLAVPTLVDFGNINNYSFQYKGQSEIIEEPSMENFRAFLDSKGILPTLNKTNLHEEIDLNALNDEGKPIYPWKVGDCITGEFEVDNKSYIIDEGNYFEINKAYLTLLNKFVDSIAPCAPPLPPAPKSPKQEENTEDYYITKTLAKKIPDAAILHKELVKRPGSTAIEICDVGLKDKKLIHIKKGTSSSDLSHLFSQATVSGELLLMDDVFRNSVAATIQGSTRPNMGNVQWIYGTDYEPGELEIVMAIMTGSQQPKKNSELLPFFSKVNLKMRCEDLKRRGYKYSVAQITTT